MILYSFMNVWAVWNGHFGPLPCRLSSSVEVNETVNPPHMRVSYFTAKISRQTDINSVFIYAGNICLHKFLLVHKFDDPSRRSQFLGNWSRCSSGQDAESHPKRRRLMVFVLRLLWRCVGSCSFRGQAFPRYKYVGRNTVPNWLFCGVHLVYRHDRGDHILPLIILL